MIALGVGPQQCVLEESPYGTSIIVNIPNAGPRECLIEDESLAQEVIAWLKSQGVEVKVLKDPRKPDI
jgi:hypothetical protein